MTRRSTFHQAIMDMATESKLSAKLRVVQPSEGSIPCFFALSDGKFPRAIPPHCLHTVDPGDLVATHLQWSDWTPEERAELTDIHPYCIECEVRDIADQMYNGLERYRPTPIEHNLSGVVEGYVDPISLLEEADRGDTHSFVGLMGHLWAAEQAFSCPWFGLSEMKPEQQVRVIAWVKERREFVHSHVDRVMGQVDPVIGDLEVRTSREEALLMLRLCEIEQAPIPVLTFLRDLAGITEPETDPEMKNLLWMRRWMSNLATPGSKVVFRTPQGDKPAPFPAKGLQQALANLREVDQRIHARRSALLTTTP